MTVQVPLARELKALVAIGAQDPVSRGEPFTTLHLLLFLLGFRAVRAAVASAGTTAEALRVATAHGLARGVANAADDARESHVALQRAAQRVHGCDRRGIVATDVLITLCESSGGAASAVLAEHGVTPLALKLHVSRLPPPGAGVVRRLLRRLVPARTPEAGWIGAADPVHVVMHDDDFTTKDFVVHVLERHFAMSRDDGIAMMQAIHEHGRCRVAQLPYATAIQRIDEVTQAARAEGFPLRLSIEGVATGLPRAAVRRR